MSLSLRSVPIVTATILAVITLAAWAALIAGTPMTDPTTFLVAWTVMMTAMMLPSAAPMVLLYRLSAGDGTSAAPRTTTFVVAYLLVWAVVGVVVLAAQSALAAAEPGWRALGAPAALLAAGVYQFTPLKATCLRACQSPADFLVRHWRGGLSGALRLGFDYGVYCLGCCWALMVVVVAAGGMGLAWVTPIALIVLVEKLFPRAAWFARVVGVVFVLSALVVGVGLLAVPMAM